SSDLEEVHQPLPVAAEGEAANAGKRGGAGGPGRRGAGADLSGKFLCRVGNLSGAGASNWTRPGTERRRNGRSGRRAMRSGGGAGVSSGGRGEGAAGNKQEQPEAARRSGATAGTAAGAAAEAVRAEADRAARLPSVDELDQRYERFNRLYFENLLPRADDVTIEWSRRMTSAAGRCYTKRRIIRLSTHYHEKFPEEVDQTLLHEMIHLLVPNHGPLFHLWLRRIRE